MFTLVGQTAKIAHLNIREEKHGDKSVTAVDVKVVVTMVNDFLNDLSPGLLQSLYQQDRERLPWSGEGADPNMRVVQLRHPLLAPFKWTAERTGWLVEFIDDPIAVVVFAKVSISLVECKDGGSVVFTLKVQCHPESEDIATLSNWLGSYCKFSMRAPNDDEKEEQASFDLEGEEDE
jgi:hypothetical protein